MSKHQPKPEQAGEPAGRAGDLEGGFWLGGVWLGGAALVWESTALTQPELVLAAAGLGIEAPVVELAALLPDAGETISWLCRDFPEVSGVDAAEALFFLALGEQASRYGMERVRITSINPALELLRGSGFEVGALAWAAPHPRGGERDLEAGRGHVPQRPRPDMESTIPPRARRAVRPRHPKL